VQNLRWRFGCNTWPELLRQTFPRQDTHSAEAAYFHLKSKMQLEDHLGDIIRKARAMRGVPARAAAVAAGLTEAEFAAFEESGVIGKQFNLASLARALGLDETKLAAIAAGWIPRTQNLARWRRLELIRSTAGSNVVNCYLVWDEQSAEAALFDVGWHAQPIFNALEQNRLELKHVFITHTHNDHIAALDQIQRRFPNAHLHAGLAPHSARQPTCVAGPVELGRLKISMRPTPGHADDAASYIVENWPQNAPAIAVVGDAIFAGSIGWGFSSWQLGLRSVAEQILTLPDDTLICPGHGPLTTVAEEKAHNPFL